MPEIVEPQGRQFGFLYEGHKVPRHVPWFHWGSKRSGKHVTGLDRAYASGEPVFVLRFSMRLHLFNRKGAKLDGASSVVRLWLDQSEFPLTR